MIEEVYTKIVNIMTRDKGIYAGAWPYKFVFDLRIFSTPGDGSDKQSML